MSRFTAIIFALSVSFLALPSLARPCRTIERLHVDREFVGPLTWAEQQRPLANFFIDSETRPLRVHYVSEENLERAEDVMALVEEAWSAQVDEQGFRAPLPDLGEGGDERLDVYVTLVLPALAVTVASDEVAADDRYAKYAHIRLDTSIRDEELPAFVVHEFQHVLQFATDAAESLMFFEASAVVQERLAYPELDAWFGNYEDFQSLPNLPVFANGIQWQDITNQESFYEYGASLFLLYLEQMHADFDGTLLRRLWEGSVQSSEVNEPDWLDVLDNEIDVALPDLVVDFSTWRALVASKAGGDGLLLGERVSGSGALRTQRFLPQSLDGSAILFSQFDRLGALGCFSFELTTSPNLGYPVRIEASIEHESALLSLAHVSFVEDQPQEREELSERSASIDAEFDIAAGEARLFSLCVLDAVDADDEIELNDIALRITRTDLPPPPDAGVVDVESPGDGGDDPLPPNDCNCQSAKPGLGSMTGILFGLGVLGFLLRARTTAKRRRLKRDYEKKREDRSKD